MARMMHLFRKYQYILLVVFGVLLMVVFVVGDALQSMSSAGPGGAARPQNVVLTWKNGHVTDSDLYNERARHNIALEYLRAIMEETTKREGSPKGAGIFTAQSDRDLIRKLLLTEKAKSLGLTVDNDAIYSFLYQLGDGELQRNDFAVLFSRTVGSRMSQSQMMDQLEKEILAQQMLMMMRDGLFAIPPREAWEMHNRLRRRVQTEMVALNVDDFKDKVAGNPSEAQIQALYEQGKDRFPDPNSPEVGFKRRRKIAFEYVRSDFDKFHQIEVAAIKPEITDEEIEEHYNENKERYRMLDLPSDDTTEDETGADSKPEQEGGESAGESAEGDEKAGEESKDDDATPAGEQAKPAAEDDSAAPAPPEDAPAAKDKQADPETEEPAAAPAEESESPDSGNESAGESDSDGCLTAQEEQEDVEAAPQEQAAGDDAPAGTEADEAAAPAVAAPAPESESDPEPENPAAVAREDVEPEDAAAKPETTAEDGQQPADSDAAAQPSTPGGEAETTAEETPEEPKYKPLDEELREEIRTEIAEDRGRKPAQDKLAEAQRVIESAINKFGRQQRLLEITPDAAQPEPVDYPSLAAEHGLTAGKIDLVDPYGVEEYELGKSFQTVFTSWPPQRVPFTQIAYRDGWQPYRVERIKGAELNIEFLYWKTDEEEGFVPELEDIRDEIVDAWKTQEAYVLARAKAESLLKEAGDKTLGEAFGEREGLEILQPPEFSWMTVGMTPFGGGGQPSLSTIAGVEGAGNDFMKSVFSLSSGEAGIATNQAQTAVYLVRIASDSPPEDLRKELFLASGITPEMRGMAPEELFELWDGWYDDLEKELKVVWNN